MAAENRGIDTRASERVARGPRANAVCAHADPAPKRRHVPAGIVADDASGVRGRSRARRVRPLQSTRPASARLICPRHDTRTESHPRRAPASATAPDAACRVTAAIPLDVRVMVRIRTTVYVRPRACPSTAQRQQQSPTCGDENPQHCVGARHA